MPIQFVSGDLFANAFAARAIAHGCNCEGSMGAGIAKGFRERYPVMYEQFRTMCKAKPRQFNLGDAWLWKSDDQPWVFNLATQEGIWRARASYEAIETALSEMRRQADREGISSIAVPRIGVGYGGLSWKKVRAIIERIFHDWPGQLIVYEDFVPSGEEVSIPSDDVALQASSRKPLRKKAARMKTRFRAITIACTDPVRTARFYETVLGEPSGGQQTTESATGFDWAGLISRY